MPHPGVAPPTDAPPAAGDQIAIDAETLRVLKHVRGAHMTFATSVVFSPDEQFIISGSSDASAVLTRIARPPSGGGGTLGLLLLLLALAVALAALLLGLLLQYAAAQPEEARALVAPLAPALQRLAAAQWLPPAAQEALRPLI